MKTILEIVAEYGVDVQKQGQLYRGFCPFHNDAKNPNFTVYEATNSWFCYAGCGGGDVIQFVSKIENISRADAKLKLENVKIEVEELREKIEQCSELSKQLEYNQQLDITASKMFHSALLKNPAESQYYLGKMQEFDNRLKEPVLFCEMVKILQNLKQDLGV